MNIKLQSNAFARLLAIFLTLFTVTSSWATVQRASNGNYQVKTQADLVDVAAIIATGSYVAIDLCNDIQLMGQWTPINGTYSTIYFHGHGHTISNLIVEKDGLEYAGLFSRVSNFHADSLTIEVNYVTGTKGAGAFVGYSSSADFNYCFVKPYLLRPMHSGHNVTSFNAGGFVGDLSISGKSSFQYCGNSANVSCLKSGQSAYIGGFGGGQGPVSFYHCYNLGKVYAIKNTKNTYTYGRENLYAVLMSGFAYGGYAGCTASYCYNAGELDNTANAEVSDNPAYAIFANHGLEKHCYYLEGTKGNRTGDEKDGIEKKSIIDFVNGTVAMLLNEDPELKVNIWKQTLAVDKYPVIEAGHKSLYPKGSQYTNNPEGVDMNYSEDGISKYDGSYQPAEKSGSVYKISNVGQLMWFGKAVESTDNSINGMLVADINCQDYNMLPIGTVINPYKGVFNGNNHIISNLNIKASHYAGLFGYIYDAKISNINMVSCEVYGKEDAAVLVGRVFGTSAKISYCRVSQSLVYGERYVGAIAGELTNGTLEKCQSVNSKVYGEVGGGIVGLINGSASKIRFCADRNSYSFFDSSNNGFYGNFVIGSIESSYSLNSQQTTPGDNAIFDRFFYTGTSTNAKLSACSKTSQAFVNGEVTWLLNAGNETSSAVWRGLSPSFTGDIVYKKTICDNKTVIYTTELADVSKHIFGDNGVCSRCHSAYQAAELNNDVYEISNYGQLVWFANYVNTENKAANAKLMSDIAVTSTWKPITVYKGDFDGNGHKLTDFNVREGENTGFVATLQEGKIHDLTIEAAISVTASRNVGAIAGYLSSGEISNCIVSGQINSAAEGYVGALVGSAAYGTVKNSYSKAVVTSENAQRGSLVGFLGVTAKIESCYAYVYSQKSLKLVSADSKGTITNSFHYGDDETDPTAMTYGQFSSGEVCYLLNGESYADNVYWRQEVSNGTPSGTGEIVYPFTKCDGHTISYSNNPNKIGQAGHNVDQTMGVCTSCLSYFEGPIYNSITGFYEIRKVGHLLWFAQQVKDIPTMKAMLMKSIDFNSQLQFTPIAYFKGEFDGNGFAINNLNIAVEGESAGFICEMDGAYIHDLTLKGNINVNSSNEYVGGFAGISTNSRIERCENIVSIKSDRMANTGGFVGRAKEGTTIEYCCNFGNADANAGINGSIIGFVTDPSVKVNSCFSYNADDVRPLVVAAVNGLTLTNSYCYGANANVANYRSAEEFESGAVCFDLNGKQNAGIWKQRFKGEEKVLIYSWYGNNYYEYICDKYPVLKSDYNVYAGYKCESATANAYYNTADNTSANMSHDVNESGYCKRCNEVASTPELQNGTYLIKNDAELEWYFDHAKSDNFNYDAQLQADVTVRFSAKEKALDLKTVFDGNGHSIDYGGENGALFNSVSGQVRNLKLIVFWGLLTNKVNKNGVIDNCEVAGETKEASAFTYENEGYIENCVNNASIDASGSRATGAFASVSSGRIRNCVNNGAILSYNSYVGGIVGSSTSSSYEGIYKCTNKGKVECRGEKSYVGGIAGYAYTVEDCVNEAEVLSTYSRSTTDYSDEHPELYIHESTVGGIVGRIFDKMEDCVNRGNVTASVRIESRKDLFDFFPSYFKIPSGKYVAGLAGLAMPQDGHNTPTIITGCANYGKIDSYIEAGMVGRAYKTEITKSHNSSSVYNTSFVGEGEQLVLTNCYIEKSSIAFVREFITKGSPATTNKISNCLYVGPDEPRFLAYFNNFLTDATGNNKQDGKGTVEVTHCLTSSTNTVPGFVSVSEKSLANGASCAYLRLGEGGDVWKQILGQDPYPTFEGDAVVYRDGKYQNEGCTFHNGFCRCGKFQEPKYENGVYQIANAGQLFWFADMVNNQTGGASKKAALVADIECDDEHIWVPMGTENKPFTGNFDGHYHEIRGLKSEGKALFGYCKGGLYNTLTGTYSSYIQNVGIINSTFSATPSAALVGEYSNYRISNCYAYGNTSSCGLVYKGTGNTKIENCFADKALCYSISGTYSNCYQNVASATTSSVSGLTKLTSDKFEGGEVCCLLNDGDGKDDIIWFQNLETDIYPNFVSKDTVYKNTSTCSAAKTIYANEKLTVTDSHVFSSLGRCACGEFEEATKDGSYYLIKNLGNLYWFAQQVNKGGTKYNAKLMADLTMKKTRLHNQFVSLNWDWTPIGTQNKPYCGKFNGNKHTITGSGTETPLFGYCAEDTVSLSGRRDIYYTSTIDSIGVSNGLVLVYNANNTKISYCYSTDKPLVSQIQKVEFNSSFTTAELPAQKIWTIDNKLQSYYSNLTSKLLIDAIQNKQVVSSNTFSNYANNKERFNSGEICDTLNGVKNIWKQNIGVDSLPSFEGRYVYKVFEHDSTVATYSNVVEGFHTEADIVTNGVHSHESDVTVIDGLRVCNVCNKILGQALNVENGICFIENVEQLKLFRDAVNSGEHAATNAKLLADIDLADVCNATAGSWASIGTSTHPYTGTFDGGSHNVSGLYISGGDNIGLFGNISGATVKDLTVDGEVTGRTNVAGLVGNATGTSVIENCVNKAKVSASSTTDSNVGGVVGIAQDASTTIKNCANYDSISGVKRVGGVVGYGKTIEHCSNFGAVSSTNMAGGIVGHGMTGTVTNCANFGTISATSNGGGIAGYTEGHITSSFNYASVVRTSGTDAKFDPICYTTNIDAKNCYYNSEATYSSTEKSTKSGVKAATAAEFESGLVTYGMNLSNTGYKWYQTLGYDAYPVTEGAEVFGVYTHGATSVDTYVNDTEGYHTEADIDGSHNANPICTAEGQLVCSVCGATTSIKIDASGTYLISNAAELVAFREIVKINKSANAKLLNDIDLSSVCGETIGSWEPIGKSIIAPYSGTFDGNGNTIENLYINSTKDTLGLFGVAKSAVIKNLSITGEISGNKMVASFIGYAENIVVTGCVNNADVHGNSYAAGIVANVYERALSKIEECVNNGAIYGYSSVGGIVGAGKSVSKSINYGNVTGTNSSVGGIVGYLQGSLTACANYATITGETNSNVGGLVGYATASPKFKNCFNVGNVLRGINNNFTGFGAIYGYASNQTLDKCFYNSEATYSCNVNENNAIAASAAEFASGKVAYELGEPWGQIIGSDLFPVLGGETVYAVYAHGATEISEYANSTDGKHTEADEDGSHDANYICDANGDMVCSVCSKKKTFEAVDGVYLIHNAAELVKFREIVKTNATANAKLMNDIDLSSVCGKAIGSWEPLGNGATNAYKGVFDGGEHTISNLYISGNNSNVGLFKAVSSAVIKNLTVKGDVSGDKYVGGFVGQAMGAVSIKNCINEVNVTATTGSAGGIIGSIPDGAIIDSCENYGSVSANSSSESNVGGIVGYSLNCTKAITNCSNYGSIKGIKRAGGIIGYGKYAEKCVNYGTVESRDNMAGGIVGHGDNGKINCCANFGKISGSGTNVGGIVGYQQGNISSCYNYGDVVRKTGSGTSFGPICGSTGYKAVNSYYNSNADYAFTPSKQDVNPASATDFESGMVAIALGEPWGQTIGTDKYPVLGGEKVNKAGWVKNPTYFNGDTLKSLAFNETQELLPADDIDIKAITYTRKVELKIDNNSVAGRWGTLCLPFDFDAANCNATLFSVGNISDAGIVLVQLSGVVEAGTPVIYYHSKAADLTVTASNVNLVNEPIVGWGLMQGTFNEVNVPGNVANNYFYLKNNQFFRGNENGGYTLNRYRAHIYVGEGMALKSLRLVLPGQDEDGVVEETTEDVVTPAIVEATYNVSGQRVSEVERGKVYLLKMSDGTTRKVVVK